MSDTVFFELKLKRGKEPLEVFEKMAKSIKKKGATKNWSYEIDESAKIFSVDFGDEKSENFVLHFEKQLASGFCKVAFPLEGDLYEDDKKSEFKIFLNMIYSARKEFSSMKISDDYGLAESFMESKEFKLRLRELTSEEKQRAQNVYDAGFVNCSQFTLKLIYNYLEIPYEDEYEKYVRSETKHSANDWETMKYVDSFVETFLFMTSEYKDRGRLYLDYEYPNDLNGLTFSVAAFVTIVEEIIKDKEFINYDNNRSFGVTHGQLRKYYKKKLLPLLEQERDSFEKCILIYRFFVSAYDFCGFKYVGKDQLLLDYEKNLGKREQQYLYSWTEEATRIFKIYSYKNVVEGYTMCVTFGLSRFGKTFSNNEIVLLLDDDVDSAKTIFCRTINCMSKNMIGIQDGLCTGVILNNGSFDNFEAKYNKSGLYFTKMRNVNNSLPFITDVCTMNIAFFVTKEECEYIKNYGCEAFEKLLNNSGDKIWKLNRESLV